nr:centrosomal protein [Tanacetum cinerariifolium]
MRPCFSDNGNVSVVTQQPTNYSGWSVENNDPIKPNDSNPKPKLGVVGAGLAGVVLITGLAFAVFSITKSGSVSKWKMTTQQQETLSSAEENDTVEEYDGRKDDNTILEGKTAPQVLPGKVIVPAVVDQVQAQTLAALQVLKVIEGNVQPGDICTRREYARWSTMSKVYPAMYIQNVTELAFDDITPEDPDFSSIQGLAEAGLIGSKLSRYDMNPSDQDESVLNFCPESPLSRQDLVSWKMSLEKRVLPVADRMILQQCSGFIDIDKINLDAWPALIADLSAGEQGIIALAFGYTRLFQPDKPVTKAQAAVALASGEASDVVSEELARIEAESIAEKAVAAHTALVEQVEKDLNAKFEKDLLLEMEKITTVEKMAEDVKQELENLKAEREKENIKLMEERAAVDSEMEVFSKLRLEVEEQLSSIMSNKVEILHEKERLNKLLTDVEIENEEIAKLQRELEIERKALSMARSWAEDEAKRTREQAKVLEEARDHWKSQGIKIVVDQDLHEDANAGATWLRAGDQLSVEGTKSRAQNLVDKLKPMTTNLKGKSKEIIEMIIQKVLYFISQLKEWTSKTGKHVEEVKVKLTHKFKT